MNICQLLVKVILLFLCLSSFTGHAGEIRRVLLGEFSAGSLQGWEEKIFNELTEYRIERLASGSVLRAESIATASGLYKKQRIDLTRTPFINWRWRIDKSVVPGNERIKSGDDYAARVYLVVSGGLAFWRTRAVNYVWSASQPQGAVWPNAYTGDNVKMLAVRDRRDGTGVWMQEKRNVREDLRNLFGQDVRYIDAVAIMTDSDDSKGHAVAYYGDIFFTAE